MEKNKRKIIRDMLFEVYDKGVKNEECNLDFYYEKMMQALNIPCVIKSVCSCGRREINVLSGICDMCWNEKFPDEQTVL